MEKGIIDKYDVAKVILFGACNDRIPKVGTNITDLPTSDLIWAERLLPIIGFNNRLPLWALSGDGYGNGDGNGYGDGYGYGYGNGNGDGYGNGDGNGNGDGYGDGDGNGNGDGNGYGYGNGNGDGNGNGYGNGYKKLPNLLN